MFAARPKRRAFLFLRENRIAGGRIMAAKKCGSAARGKSQVSMVQPKKCAPAARLSAKEKEPQKPAKAVNRKNSLAWKSRLKAEYAQFKLLEERIRVVEQSRRGVYAYLVDMIHSNIDLAGEGNYLAAKFLMEFAGIDKLPVLSQEQARNPTVAAEAGAQKADEEEDDPTKAVLSFYKKLGMTPLRLKPPKPTTETQEPSTESVS